MLLIRISGKDYTFSREAWSALVGATNSGRIYYYPARGRNLTIDDIESLISPTIQITKPLINPQEHEIMLTDKEIKEYIQAEMECIYSVFDD